MLLKTNCKLLLKAFIFFFIFFNSPAFADVKLPQLISDHMVLQRDIKLKIWRWASPNENLNTNPIFHHTQPFQSQNC